MRRIWRPTVHPPELSRAGRKGFEYAKAQRDGNQPRDKFKSYWRSEDVRGVLKAMCGWSCAYCGDVIGRPGEDVEHFRPKNLYWFLAYSVPNYLSSCRRCNSSRKVNNFPLEPGAAVATGPAAVKTERRLLLDPVVDDVERVLKIELTSNRYEWVVDDAAPKRLRARAERTITFFRLNSDTELLRLRIDAIQNFLLDMESTDSSVRSRALLRASRFNPQGAAVRSVLAQTNSDLLPSLEEEVVWHVQTRLEELKLALAGGAQEKAPATFSTYALAALWADPPTGITKTKVAGWYEDAGVVDIVKPIVDELRVPPPTP